LDSALRVSYLSITWGALSGGLAIIFGVRAHSTAPVGTGVAVLADLISTGVLIWRFRAERDHKPIAAEDAERRAQLVSSSCLLAVAVGLLATAVPRLIAGEGATPDAMAVTLAAASVGMLPLLCQWKYRVASQVNSRALRTDAHIGVIGATTAALTLLGLLLTARFHWHAADPIAGLIIGVIAAVTGTTGLASPTTRSK